MIRFLTEVDYPPFNYAGPDGSPIGFNVDLARLICEELKVQCTVQMRRFDTLITALAENRGDAVMASIAVTPDMRRLADFSDPYYRTPARFVTRRDVVLNDVRPERLEGKEIAVVAGTAHEAYLKSLFTEADLRSYPSSEQAREALRRGDVDLLFGDAISLAFWLNGTELAELLRLPRRSLHREPLFRRRHRHRGQARQRHAAPGAQLVPVPAVGEGPLQRPVASLFSHQPVLKTAVVPSLPARGGWPRSGRVGRRRHMRDSSGRHTNSCKRCASGELLPTPALRADPPLAGRDGTADAATDHRPV